MQASRRPHSSSDRRHRHAARPRLEALESRVVLSLFAVTGTGDNGGVDPAPFAGTGTIRQALVDANANTGLDTIIFAIASGAPTISPQAALPAINDAVVLDGTTQPGYVDTPIIELDGSLAGVGANGLTLQGSDCAIRGLVINRFDGSGILVTGPAANRNVIAGNYIGTDAAGTAARGNGGDGIRVEGIATGNTIGGTTEAARNIISGNGRWGVFLTGAGVTGNLVAGNYIGTDVSSNSALSNGIAGEFGGGILVLGAPNNMIGGVVPRAGNVISGNANQNVGIAADGIRLQGNLIGTNKAGTATVGTTQVGVGVSGKNDVIGGNDADDGTIDGCVRARNLISVYNGTELGLPAVDVTGTRIQGNYIGTTIDGCAFLGSGVVRLEGTLGLHFGGTEPGAGNVVSYYMFGYLVSHMVIQGNIIGRNAGGTAALGGGNLDIQPNVEGDVLIGGTTCAARNILSSLLVSGGPFPVPITIQGNYIGTDITGTVPLYAQSDVGILVTGVGTVIGGPEPGDSNVIRGSQYGVLLDSGATHGVLVQGNRIGIGADGVTPLGGDTAGGVAIDHGAHGNTIGGTALGAGNVISGNSGPGVHIASFVSGYSNGGVPTGNLVLGNLIGTDATGTRPVCNGGDGVRIGDGAVNNIIGGTVPGAGNLIAYNAHNGVTVVGTSVGNAIRGNTIYESGGLGIDLGDDGNTPNDSDDADVGPNNLQNVPLLTTFMAGGTTRVGGTLQSTRDTAFAIDVFANAASEPRGNEGRRYLGSFCVTTDAAGNASFDETFSAATAAGERITATATGPDGTSEFSVGLAVTNQPPTANAGGPYVIDEGGSLSLDGPGSYDPDGDPLVYNWDLNGDGIFGDATRDSPTINWAQLVALGINDGPRTVPNVGLRVDDGHGHVVDSPTTTLIINNVAPTAVLKTNDWVTYGNTATATLADPFDPSTADTDDGLHYAFSLDTDTTGLATYATSGTSNTSDFGAINAGTHTVYARIIDKDGASSCYTGTLRVSKADATVTVHGYSGAYDVASHGATGSFLGVAGDLSAAGSSLSLGSSFTNAPGGTANWTFSGGTNYNDQSGSVEIVIAKATPVIAWSNPADITYGTALGAAQLDATASVPGTFLSVAGTFHYTPDFGALLQAGLSQSLATSFVPTDTVDFDSASKTVSINVFLAQPTFSSLSGPTIPYGAVSTNLGGHLAAGTLAATGSVNVTLNGVTQAATINSSGDFSATFNTATLAVAGSPYTITYAYAGTPNFAVTSATASLIVLSAQEQVALVESQVNTLVTTGVLNGGNGNALTAKLDSATANLSAGKTAAGVNQLNAFINQVNAFQKSGTLSGAQAQALIAAANQAIASASGSGAHLMIQDSSGSSSTGDSQPVARAGELLTGTVGVALENGDGSTVPADEEARFQDALSNLNATFGFYGVNLVEVAPVDAIVRVDIGSTSAAGNAADGVLGCTVAGQITLVTGWNWYTGADPTQISASQYDFQTIVTHELGHAAGLGHSGDTSSVMYAYLAPGETRRGLTAQDLFVLDSDTGNAPEPLTAAAWRGRTASVPQVGVMGPARTVATIPAAAAPALVADAVGPDLLGIVSMPQASSPSRPRSSASSSPINSRVSPASPALRSSVRAATPDLGHRAVDSLLGDVSEETSLKAGAFRAGKIRPLS